MHPNAVSPQKEIVEKYFDWLCMKTGVSNPRGVHGSSYRLLAKTLYEIPYIWTIPGDRCREADARSLYYDFQYDCPEANLFSICPNKVSMLELIYALAIRIERQFMRIVEYGDRTNMWFYEMLNNIGLDVYDDQNFDSNSEYAIRQICSNFMNNNYDYNGRGGLFPIEHPTRDQRTIELWSQLNDYLNERI